MSEEVLVLLVEFQGKDHNPSNTPAAMLQKMNGNNKGDLRHYFREASYDNYVLTATIGGNAWFRSSRTETYYGTDSTTGIDDFNGQIYNLVREVVQLADPVVDFSSFDADGDGVVDHLVVIHAGDGQESTRTTTHIWSHRWAIVNPNLYVDGVQAFNYILVAESSPIGVIAHEFGHDLGLPDLYDTDQSSIGAGVWDIMATGSWNGLPKGTSPAHPGAWCKAQLGWVEVIEITRPSYSMNIPEIETFNVTFKLQIGSSGSGEYFLVENRERVGSYDTSLPGQGLLIWHIDESVSDNDNDMHRMVDLEEADHASSGDSPDDAADAWADDQDGFTPDSVPNSNGYANIKTGWKVRQISVAGATMTADISREVDDDISIVDLQNVRSVVVNTDVVIAVEAANLGARNHTDIRFVLSIFFNSHSSDQLVLSTNRSISLLAKTFTNFTWTYRPQTQGRYIVEVQAILDIDEIPENNMRLTHFNAMTAYFFDNVETGNKGWIASPTGEQHQWQIVQDGSLYGDSMSPSNSWRFGYFGGLITTPSLYILESQTISFPAGPLHLSFFHHYTLALPSEVNSTSSDVASVSVSFNGGTWFNLTGARFTLINPDWEMFHSNLSTYASSAGTLRIRFQCTAGQMPRYGGWWIDDVFVSPYAPGPAVAILPINTARVVEPGEKAAFVFKVINIGDFQDTFRFYISSETSWPVALVLNVSPGYVLETVRITLSPDKESILSLVVQTPADVVRGTEEIFRLTVRSVSSTTVSDSFDAQVIINDPLGLAKFSRYIVLFIVVLILLVAIAMIIDNIKRRRGIR